MKLISIILVLLTVVSCQLEKQGIWNTYEGYWAETEWKFSFYANGKFKRVSRGHYGNTEVKGKYEIRQDTIEILKGFEKTDGTVGQYYLIDGDSCIIDLDSKYDYCNEKRTTYEYFEVDGEKYKNTGSRKRNFKYPQVPTEDKQLQLSIGKLITEIVHLDTLQEFISQEQIIIEEYFEINDKNLGNQLRNKGIIFLKTSDIEEQNITNYIKIEDFNLLNNNTVKFRLQFFLIKNRIKGKPYHYSEKIYLECVFDERWQIVDRY